MQRLVPAGVVPVLVGAEHGGEAGTALAQAGQLVLLGGKDLLAAVGVRGVNQCA